MSLILGNLCSVFAMASDGLSSTRKTAKGVLWAQCLSQVFYGAGSVIAKGYSGAAQNVISLLRNFSAMKKWNRRVLEWALVIGAVVLGLAVNNRGVMGLLPVVANLEYSLVVFSYKENERALKWAFLVNLALFAVFNAFIGLITATMGNVAVFVLTAVYLYRTRNPSETAEKTAQ
ncbi:MAG: YgjV family protein [Oscillospiraceae bacterium]|nr:YgjV family protein [Oscillospiraceae bacterium]